MVGNWRIWCAPQVIGFLYVGISDRAIFGGIGWPFFTNTVFMYIYNGDQETRCTKLQHLTIIWIQPQSEPTLELHSKAAPRIRRQYHYSVGPNTGRNPGGRQIKEKKIQNLVILFQSNKPIVCQAYVVLTANAKTIQPWWLRE